MSNRIDTKIILGSLRYQTAIDTDLSMIVPFMGTLKEMDEFDRNRNISLAQVFDDERQSSTIFRPSFEIDLIFYNAYSGTTQVSGNNYFPFTNNLYFTDTANSFLTGVWYGYPQYNEFDFIRTDKSSLGYTSGVNPHVYFVNKSASTYNWTQYMSYVYDNDFNKQLSYYKNNSSLFSWRAADGIPFSITNPSTELGRSIISFTCPVKHNLTVGEYVEIKIAGWAGYNGVTAFEVYSVGNGGYLSDEYIFNIYDNGFLGSTFTNNTQGTFKRIIDIENSGETKSSYYVRKHKIITNANQTILTKAAFDLNSFRVLRQYEYSSLTPDNVSRITTKEGAQSYLLTFSEDINIAPYIDNHNRPISELFLTVIHKGYFGWMNKPNNLNIPNSPSIRQGFGFNIQNFLSPYWDYFNLVNLSNIETDSYSKPGGHNFYYNKDLKSGDTVDGAFCEFNQFEQKERVISEIFHKITYNENLFIIGYILNSNGNLSRVHNPEGYYYKPHYSIKIREFSEYIEEGDLETIDGAPDYAFYSDYESSLRWRDIYTYGYIDRNGNGVDFPFLNGAHYVNRKVIFKIYPEGYVSQNINLVSLPNIDDCE